MVWLFEKIIKEYPRFIPGLTASVLLTFFTWLSFSIWDEPLDSRSTWGFLLLYSVIVLPITYFVTGKRTEKNLEEKKSDENEN